MAWALAAGAVSLMVILMLFVDGGTAAIATIAGFPGAPPPDFALRLALFCDTLLPIGYAAGFCLLAIDRAHGRWGLVGVVCLFTALGTGADFLENGFAVYGTPQPPLSVMKYGCLGVAAFALGALVRSPHILDRLAALLMQVGMPLFLAAIVSGILGRGAVWIFAAALLGSFLLGVAVARPEAHASTTVQSDRVWES